MDIMDIKERLVGDVVILGIRGDITMSADGGNRIADAVRHAVNRGHDHLVLDLGTVRYVDSAGLGELVQAYAAAQTRGGMLKLLHVTDRINDLLVLTRLLTVFECFDSESEVVDSFQSFVAVPTDATDQRRA
jgi:anti-sigma B factor antagonist